jgi:hypothetical protein
VVFFGIAIAAALLLTAMHTFMVHADRAALALSFLAFLCLAATQAIFWIFTYPMNVASNNWTVTPENFEVTRRQWKYSHALMPYSPLRRWSRLPFLCSPASVKVLRTLN